METLFRLWAAAGRPSMEAASRAASAASDQGAASKETMRKVLTGKTIPQSWHNAEAVFLGLSELAGLDPDRLVIYADDLEDYEPIPNPEAACAVFRRLWDAALDGAGYAHGGMQDYTPPPRSKEEDPFAGPPPF